MAIEIDGKIYRNIPEQVKKNKEDIEELQKSGGGSTPSDYASVKAQVTENKTNLAVYMPKVNTNTSNISTLTTNLTTETTNRINKDDELQSAINSETDARTASYSKLLTEKQDKLTAGSNIDITNNVISAKVGSAGSLYAHNINISIEGEIFLIFLTVINDSNELIETAEALDKVIPAAYFLPCSGVYNTDGSTSNIDQYPIYGLISRTMGTTIIIQINFAPCGQSGLPYSGSYLWDPSKETDYDIYDYVTEL